MRGDFAKQYAQDHSLLDFPTLLKGFETAHIIGAPGYCTRIAIDDAEVPALKTALKQNFIVGPDYGLKSDLSGQLEEVRLPRSIISQPR
jgi:hypothetical protein